MSSPRDRASWAKATAVFDEAQEVLATGQPKLLRYGITDEMAWDVGLACGGTIEVFVEPVAE